MKKRTIWALGILFGSVIAFAGWTSFENPNFLMGKTNRVYGKIIDVFPSHEVKSYSRRVKYIYAINGEFFFDFKKLGTLDKKQAIGNKILISYLITNPKINFVKKLFNDHKNSKGVKFYAISENGFIEMQLINGIFKYKEFAEKGKMVNNFVGEYFIENDTLRFKNYNFETDSIVINKPELFVIDSKNRNQLIEKSTNRIFKKI